MYHSSNIIFPHFTQLYLGIISWVHSEVAYYQLYLNFYIVTEWIRINALDYKNVLMSVHEKFYCKYNLPSTLRCQAFTLFTSKFLHKCLLLIYSKHLIDTEKFEYSRTTV